MPSQALGVRCVLFVPAVSQNLEYLSQQLSTFRLVIWVWFFFCYFWTFCQWFFSTSLPLTAWTQQYPGSVSEQLWPFRPPRMVKLTVLVIGSIAVFALSPVGVKTFSQDIYLTLVSKMWKTPFVTLLWALSVVSPSSQLWACWWNLTHRIETRLQALHHFQITSLAFENTLWYLWP